MAVILLQAFPGHRVEAKLITLGLELTNSRLCYYFSKWSYLSESKENSTSICVE